MSMACSNELECSFEGLCSLPSGRLGVRGEGREESFREETAACNAGWGIGGANNSELIIYICALLICIYIYTYMRC